MTKTIFTTIHILLCGTTTAFLPITSISHKNFGPHPMSSLGALVDDENTNKNNRSIREKVTNMVLIESILQGQPTTPTNREGSLIELTLIGKGEVGPENEPDYKTTCLFLSTPENKFNLDKDITIYQQKNDKFQCMTVPLSTSNSKSLIKLISFAYRLQPISKSLCLSLAPLLINRDGALFDNLPWDTWTIDPKKRNTDKAGNPIAKKYHLGKRDAYNRFIGKDWYGRSLSLGNLAARAKYLIEAKYEDKTENVAFSFDEEANTVLARRILELEVQDARMAVAEAEEQLAILKADLGVSTSSFDSMTDDDMVRSFDALQQSLQLLQDAQMSVKDNEEALDALISEEENTDNSSFIVGLLSAITDAQKSDAAYRGALGSKPVIDSREEMLEKSILPYSSPFDLMKEIINEQLNADIIGCVIENSSLFRSGVVFGGAIVLKRKPVKKKVSISGENIEIEDNYDDLGNDGIKSGNFIVVECDCDEAIGMALTCGLNVYLEPNIWAESKVDCHLPVQTDDKNSIIDALPVIETVNKSIILRRQGDGEVSTGTPIQAPRSTNDFMRFLTSKKTNDQTVFNTDIPVQSLDEYDEMTVQDKAQLLLSLESFNGRLPRPRALKEASTNSNIYNTQFSPLDEMMVPLIDESVRRQLLIREAKRRGDIEAADELENKKSMRQMAKESAVQARYEGKDELAAIWEKEADFYASLRADVTQDEGSYSSFLDRDEWYERNRRATAERNKKRFDSLMDGLE